LAKNLSQTRVFDGVTYYLDGFYFRKQMAVSWAKFERSLGKKARVVRVASGIYAVYVSPKGHITRKATTYRRKGKLVHRKAYSYKRRDVGAPGRTPKSKRWFEPKGHSGFRKDKSIEWNVRKVGKSKSPAALRRGIRQMVALANVTTDGPTERKARAVARRLSEILARKRR